MTQTKPKAMIDTTALGVMVVPSVRERLSTEEIARAILAHLQGEFTALRHRFADDSLQQELQLETMHEANDGQKVRVITEFHQVHIIVDLVETH